MNATMLRTSILAAAMLASLSLSGTSAGAVDQVNDRAAICCARATRLDPPTPPRTVQTTGLIGDSLSVGLTDDRFQVGPPIQELIASGGRSMWTSTSIGFNLADGLDVLVRRADVVSDTDVVVVALGTNDIVGGVARDSWRRAIDGIVRQVERASPDAIVVWVDLSAPRFGNAAAEFNAILLESAAREPSLAACGWASNAAANPQWLGSDGLHLTGTGYAARRDVIVACIDDVGFD
jgi:lysophospholipase L1-like esterase